MAVLYSIVHKLVAFATQVYPQNSMLRKTVLLVSLTLFSFLFVSAQDPNRAVDVVTIHTQYGDIVAYLYKDTPIHRENMPKLIRQGAYDSTTFHRVIPQFMIQGGDPNSRDANPGNDGNGGPGYTLPAEIRPQYVHIRGTLAAARLGDEANPLRESSGSQFYIVQGSPTSAQNLQSMEPGLSQQLFVQFARAIYPTLPEGQWLRTLDIANLQRNHPDSLQAINERYVRESRQLFDQRNQPFKYTEAMLQNYQSKGGSPHLDMQYTVFGEVLQGLQVVDTITQQPTAGANRPVSDIRMTVTSEQMTWAEMVRRYGAPMAE
jgi:cyclophilin family peptidyl-prolyl cis-trans isomerase